MENQEFRLIGFQLFNHQVNIGIKQHDHEGKTHYQIFRGDTLYDQVDNYEAEQTLIMEKLASRLGDCRRFVLLIYHDVNYRLTTHELPCTETCGQHFERRI